MLNSLLYGSESLHKTPIYEEIPTKNGKTRQVKRTVVDVKLEGQGFKIGHSRVYSQTFIPTWVEDPNFNQLWVDIAGFGDTNGDLIEYINTFIGKKIFNIAKDIKIIMPFTCGEIQDQRGNLVASLLKLMQNIFQNYLGQKSFSIIPVLTKVDPSDDEFNFDIIKDDFERLLKNELNKQFPGLRDDGEDGQDGEDN